MGLIVWLIRAIFGPSEHARQTASDRAHACTRATRKAGRQTPSGHARSTTTAARAAGSTPSGSASHSARPRLKAHPRPSTARLDAARKAIGAIEGHDLSDEQISAIAGAGRNTLVLAGAGTGKTTTINGYVTWLINTGRAKPEEILTLSFTRAAAQEMSERIHAQTGHRVQARTFHSLGLEICRRSSSGPVHVADAGRLSQAMQQTFATLQTQDMAYRRLVLSLMPSPVAAKLREWAREPNAGIPADPLYAAHASKLIDTAQTIIRHMRANGLTPDALRRLNRARGGRSQDRNEAMIRLITPLYANYMRLLEERHSVDFPGMIAQAVDHVHSGRYRHAFRYVLVDEYQDMSQPRYQLLRALREQSDFSLFCVGDDWQSIYRFAGGDVRLILDFDHAWADWGPTRLFRITVTRRFKQSLIEASGRFAMADPHLYAKQLTGPNPDVRDHSIKALGGADGPELFEALTGQLAKLPKRATVLLLGRYRTDLDLIRRNDHNRLFVPAQGTEDGDDGRLTFADRPDLDITFMTVHRSKGLQRDFTFLLNCSGGAKGFPSAIPEEPAIGLLLPEAESFPDAEERRLFYVAMTRCRKKLFLLVDTTRPSRFVYELRAYCPNALRGVKLAPQCPNCGEALTLRTADGDPSRSFWGCSAWPACAFTRNAR